MSVFSWNLINIVGPNMKMSRIQPYAAVCSLLSALRPENPRTRQQSETVATRTTETSWHTLCARIIRTTPLHPARKSKHPNRVAIDCAHTHTHTRDSYQGPISTQQRAPAGIFLDQFPAEFLHAVLGGYRAWTCNSSACLSIGENKTWWVWGGLLLILSQLPFWCRYSTHLSPSLTSKGAGAGASPQYIPQLSRCTHARC